MRLHRLEVTAFGPFAGTVEVDFDAVGVNGLFLVHGPTGAGKTSLLDAVCFALYAGVPGARPGGKALRSDHSGRDAVPVVRLEFGVGARRFRITRSPEFLRAKKRGHGETSSPAKVVLEEHVTGRWTARSSRADEVGEIVTEVLGMGLAQFSKVVLLPQGEFAAFLRATADERRTLLEKLFDISTYSGVETWLVERRRVLAGELVEAQTALGADLARLETVLAQVPGDVLAGLAAQPPSVDWSAVPPSSLPAQVAAVADRLDEHAVACLVAASEAEGRAAAAQAAATEAAAWAERRRRGETARREVAELDADPRAWEALRRSAEAAVRAEAVSGDVRAVTRLRERGRTAGQRCRRAEEAVARFGVTGWSAEPVRGWVRTLEEQAAGLDAALTAHRALPGEARRLAELEASVSAGRADVEERRRRATAAQQAVDSAGADVERLQDALAALARADHTVTTADQRAQLATEVDRIRDEVRTARDRVQSAREAEQSARDRHQTLQQSRLDGMAGELATRLVDGRPCEVCGALEHPRPATTAAPVSADEVADAAARWQALREVTQREDAAMAGHESLLAARTADLGAALQDPDVDPGTDPHLDTEAPATEASASGTAPPTAALVAGARAARGRRDILAAEVQRLSAAPARAAAARSAAETAQVALRDAVETLAAREGTVTELATQVARASAELAEAAATHTRVCACVGAAAGGGAQPVAEVASAHSRLVRDARELADALTAAEEVDRELHELEVSTLVTLRDNGFDAVDEAQAALLDREALADLQRRLRRHDDRRAAAEAVLADETVRAALDRPPVDPVRADAAADAARAELRRAQHAQTGAEASARALAPVKQSIEARVAALSPLTAEYARVAELADTAAGTGGQNTLRMRLTAFVLAARLEKVAALANERLRVMGDGRYQLAHSDDRAAGGRRSGLGLVVRDQWTGQVRDTASLSGGESFMASLALALGLADAVREEAGGFDLNTLFVDEGFGTLDDESLEQVMAVLDGLRDGGRCVGVVSHVSDLRSRIPMQIRVDKTATGSGITVLGLAAPAA